VKPSSASVFIKHRRGIDLTDRESQIKALLVNSISGLPYENVTVAMFSSNPIPVKRKHKNDNNSFISSFNDIEIQYIIITLSSVIVGLVILSVIIFLKNRKQSNQLQISNSNT
jgi:type III secretory pathway lipoprotein EscJ